MKPAGRCGGQQSEKQAGERVCFQGMKTQVGCQQVAARMLRCWISVSRGHCVDHKCTKIKKMPARFEKTFSPERVLNEAR